MAAGYRDFGAAWGAFHVDDVDADFLMQGVTFAGDLLASGHVCFFPAVQMQGNAVGADGLYGPDNNFAFLTAESLKLAFTLCFSQALHDDLFGCLRCNTSKIARCDINHHRFSSLNIGLLTSCLVECDLSFWILYLV